MAPSEKSRVIFFFGRERGIWSTQLYTSVSYYSLSGGASMQI